MTKIDRTNFLLMKLLKFSLSNLTKSVIKFYLVKVFQILMKFSYKLWSNIRNFFWWAREKKLTSINFTGGIKNRKMAIFDLHYIKVSSIFMCLQLTHNFFYDFTILKFKQIAMTMWSFIEIYWLEVLLNCARKSIFLVPWRFLRSMGAVA